MISRDDLHQHHCASTISGCQMPPSSKKRGRRGKHQSPSVLLGSISEATSEEPPKKKPTPTPKKKPNKSAAVKAAPPPKKPQPKFKPTKSPNASSIEATSLKNSPVKPASPSHAHKKQQPTPPAKKKSAPSAATVEAVPPMKPPPIIEPFKSPTATASNVGAGEDTKLKAASGQCKQRKPTKHDILWEQRYGELEIYKEEYGNCNVPQKFDKYPGLGKWVMTQRAYKKKGKLTVERKRKLDDIGFDIDPLTTAWNKHFVELEQFKNAHGHCNVPQRYDENPKLGAWVHQQRVLKKKDKLCEEREKTLNTLNFTWDLKPDLWDSQYEALLEFKSKFGDCNVPTIFAEDPSLGRWVHNQRTKFNNGGMEQDKFNKLKKIDFKWTFWSLTEWTERYNELVLYKRKYNHSIGPVRNSEFSQLSNWILNQRKKRNELDKRRLKLLNEIGFAWKVSTSRNEWFTSTMKHTAAKPSGFAALKKHEWMDHYNALKAFNAEHGHFNVPLRYVHNEISLGRWVKWQNEKFDELGKLPKDRQKLLEKI
eukprot:scaffold61109_cov22-Cyclotella_meneghiniana.AAC.5